MTSDNLAQFFSTKGTSKGGQHLWAAGTLLWPTILALAVALVTLVLSIIVLVAYRWGAEMANRWDNRRANFSKFVSVVQVVFSAAGAAGMYQTGSNPKTLWGQTCGVQPRQSLFPEINFKTYCLMQVLFVIYEILIVEFGGCYDACQYGCECIEPLYIYLWLYGQEKQKRD